MYNYTKLNISILPLLLNMWFFVVVKSFRTSKLRVNATYNQKILYYFGVR